MERFLHRLADRFDTPAVKLDRTVLTNNTDIAVDGDKVSVTTAIFGGNVLVTTTFTGDPPYLAVFRPKSFAAGM